MTQIAMITTIDQNKTDSENRIIHAKLAQFMPRVFKVWVERSTGFFIPVDSKADLTTVIGVCRLHGIESFTLKNDHEMRKYDINGSSYRLG